jgi:hypothetical protein
VQKQVTAKFDRTWETNLNEKSGAIGAESVVKRGKRTSGGVSAGLPGIYFAEILGFATLRPTTAAPHEYFDHAGANWNALNTGQTALRFTSLVIDPWNPGTLYAGSLGGGVFAISVPD